MLICIHHYFFNYSIFFFLMATTNNVIFTRIQIYIHIILLSVLGVSTRTSLHGGSAQGFIPQDGIRG